MPFKTDKSMKADARKQYGDYLTTFVSDHEQVRADLFRLDGIVTAHIMFPTGLSPTTTTDTYHSDIYRFAVQQGCNENNFRISYY